MKYLYLNIVFLLCSFFSCAESINSDKQKFYLDSSEIVSGEILKINANEEIDNNIEYKISLINSNREVIETYQPTIYKNYFIINRFLNQKVASLDNYNILVEADELRQTMPIQIMPSVIIESFCAKDDCNVLTGNVVQNISNKIVVNSFKIRPVKFVYTITTPYQTIEKENLYNTPVSRDWLQDIVFQTVPDDVSFYIAKINIKAYDNEDTYAETSLPFKVVRPIEVKHFGKYELAEVYEPVPVTGCIPGTIGSNVQYTESESETRQNSVSMTIDKSWSDSLSLTESISSAEGISVGETTGTVNSSSISNSETQSESISDTSSESESSDISFNTTDGENWSWSLGESNSGTQGQTQGQNSNTSLNGSTTVGTSGEGSLPFLAKVSGKLEVTAGISSGWGETSSTSSSETNSSNRGYSTGGSSQNGRTFGSSQNSARSHSLTGSYVLSSSTSNSISESSSLSSTRVWNMSESVSSGSIVTSGNRESISQTIVNSNSSATTFSYSGYIPRGRYGIFHRQTSRYVKLSEIITYNLNGFPQHRGFIMMNTWSWAPDLTIGESCETAIQTNLPIAECFISPCN
ncbi:hypothetical protein HOK09_03135 [Candidatus Woesearchaeota archaeon]|jgi:hypothetical protein|nr:hypothetical protein [Candidatus Woesearchaeota archaeon]